MVRHMLSDHDYERLRATCNQCGITTITRHGEAWVCENTPYMRARREASLRATEPHQLSDYDLDHGIATCSICGPNTKIRAHGKGRWACYGAPHIQRRLGLIAPEETMEEPSKDPVEFTFTITIKLEPKSSDSYSDYNISAKLYEE